jgi:hypothetical protein
MWFYAAQGFNGDWWVALEWPRSRHRYGGCSLLRCVGSREQTEAVAADMNAKAAGWQATA